MAAQMRNIMYLVTAKVAAWEEDFPGSRVEWKIGQSREVHDSLVSKFRNNPASWTVSGGSDSSPMQATKTLTGRIEIFGGEEGGANLSLVFGLVPGDEAAATSNTSKIQAALDRHGCVQIPTGLGVIYHNARFIIGSNTTLDLGGNTLKRTATTFQNSIVTESYTSTPVSVTVSWSSGVTATIGLAAHGKSVGDYICIYGTPAGTGTPSTFQGVFRVASVVDSGNITVTLPRKPTASPSGTWFAVFPTENIAIKNGWIDFNTGSSASDVGTMGVIMAFCCGWKVEDVSFRSVLKYCVFTYNTLGGRVLRLHGETLSDGVHVFGPARNVVVDGITGHFGDDIVAVSSRDLTGNWVDVSGGDIIGVRASNLSGTSATALAQIFSHIGYVMDDVEYSNITGYCANATVSVFGDPTDGGSINKLVLSGISAPGAINISSYGGGTVPLTIQSLIIRDSCLQSKTDVSSYVTFGAYATVKKLTVENCISNDALGTSGVGIGLILNGTVEELAIVGGRYALGSNGRLVMWAGTTAGTKKISMDNVSVEGGNCIINKGSTVTDTPQIVLNNSRFKSTYDVLALSSNADVVRHGCTFESITGAVVHVYNAAATAVNDWESGCQYPSTADAKRVVCAAGTYNPKSLDIRVDVGATGIAKTAGNLAFNIGSGRGTLTQNRHVTCNGTNYVQIDTPANVF